MDALSPGGRPLALRPIEGGAKAHPEGPGGRHGIRDGVRADAAGSVSARDAATVVQLSDEALALAARAPSGDSPGDGIPASGSDAQGEGASTPVSPAVRASLLERFVRAQEPPPEPRMIDARA